MRNIFNLAINFIHQFLTKKWASFLFLSSSFAVYHANCRLPDHIDRSYGAYVERVKETLNMPALQIGGKDLFRYTACPKKLVEVNKVSPDFHPSTPVYVSSEPQPPKNIGTQSLFRESSAQTIPWQPDGKANEKCENTPEVLYLDRLKWGPGFPYRVGDLPADFHTTEIINKMRHARTWMEVVERAQIPRWMKKRDQIISDVETKDWIFREAEIDELQDIRLKLLHKLQVAQRTRQATRTSRKLSQLWTRKKSEMEHKMETIRRTRDRELRKLSFLHSGGGRAGLVARMRGARGGGDVTAAVSAPDGAARAPLARNGYHASRRHAQITYDPSLLVYEDHVKIAEPPAWLEHCCHDLKRSCSGHHVKKDDLQLCERETKWSEEFLKNLHEELKKTRLGAAAQSAGPLHVLKPRRLAATPRPLTPAVESVPDDEENWHQSALLLQRVIRGRAVQTLMYEGRTRAAELTEELKTTHGLQAEDKIRIAKEEFKAREYNALRTEAESKEDAVNALVDELCGGAVSAALDFLEKELRRLKEERRQHALILIAIREKTMREAAEAGRRQREEHRRREHDEMFKQVLGVTQETVDAYLMNVIEEGVELSAETQAVARARADAEKLDAGLKPDEAMSTAEQNELVAELVQQFLLPEAHKAASRHRVAAVQRDRLQAAREAIFGLIDTAEKKEVVCYRCGAPLGDLCRCEACDAAGEPVETDARDDPRWAVITAPSKVPPKPIGERYPPQHEFRCMLNVLVDEAVAQSHVRRREAGLAACERAHREREAAAITLTVKAMLDVVVEKALGTYVGPVKKADFHYYMRRYVADALGRTEPFKPSPFPKELPSETRSRLKEESKDTTCYCDELRSRRGVQFGGENVYPQLDPAMPRRALLPSEVRALEEMRRCKCDAPSPPLPPPPPPAIETEPDDDDLLYNSKATSLKSDASNTATDAGNVKD